MMSTSAADVFSDNSYAAPKAELRDVRVSEATPDRLFSCEGRLGVMAYNARIFWCLLGMVAAFAPAIFLFVTQGEAAFEAMGGATLAALGVGAIGALFFVVIAVSAAVKRLHDLGKSGWWYLLGLVPLLGSLYTLYYSLAPAKADDNKFGAQRHPSTIDKVVGWMGIAIVVLSFLGSIADLAGVLG